MRRKDFLAKSAIGMLTIPFLTNFQLEAAFLKSLTVKSKVPLGLDAHAVRGMKWNAKQLVDYAIDLKMDSLLFNSLNYFESLETSHLKKIKRSLDKNQMTFFFGIGGLSVNSTSYSSKLGSPKDKILEGIRIAKIFDSKSVNCKIGSIKDRYTDGGITARMDEIITELRSMRSQIQDAGIKFAVENHAGDLRSEEVLQIVETVGTDVCGVMLDPGNSVWAMENPMDQLEKLGKHAVCSSVRDYNIWESENGAAFQWTPIGEGSMDFKKYTKRMSELCPGTPLHIESISRVQIEIPFLEKDFWKGYPDLKASELKDFHNMLRRGKPMDLVSAPEGIDPKEFEQNAQKIDLLKSIEYLRKNCEAIKR
ncbi:MAG: TIM barrel protein [Reichenbachiella sp.]